MPGYASVGVEAVYSAAVAVGTGTVECAHGIMPLPAPATSRLLQGVPVVPTSEPSELTTPTGAAVLTALVESWDAPPAYVGVSSGMGAGSREGKTRANLLRLIIGSTAVADEGNSCIMIEAVIDDLDPRIWPVLNAGILAAGAFDCYARNCLGKKGRPAMELVVHLPEGARESVLSVVFAHSSTLGVRISDVERVVLQREFKKVSTRYGCCTDKRAGRIVPRAGYCSACKHRLRCCHVGLHSAVLSLSSCSPGGMWYVWLTLITA